MRTVWWCLSVWLGTALAFHTSVYAQTAPQAAQPEAEAAPATAENSEGDAAELDRAARSLFAAGKIAFDLGRYEEALEYLTQAYQLSQRPLLLFNIASTLDRLRRDAEALETFDRYLTEVPDAPNRPAVESRVRLLREAVERAKAEEAARQAAAQQEQAAAAADAQAQAGTAAPPHEIVMVSEQTDGGGLSPVVFFVGAGLTVVSGVFATVSGLNTISARDQYEQYAQSQEPSAEAQQYAKELYDDGVARQTRTNVLIGLTGALAVGTVVMAFLTDWGGDDEQPQVGAAGFVSTDGGGVSFNGHF